MNKNRTLTVALAALFSSSMAIADITVSSTIKIEHAALTSDGSTIGSDVVNTGFTAFKDEIKIQLIADGDITDNMTFHAEVLGHSDGSATSNYQGLEDDTQRDGFRELYVDYAIGDSWDLRLGKQQVVWGTADGMKLLDAINPTDYSEMAQNQMEDSRIPMWMVNLEKDGNQLIVAETKSSRFAGLGRASTTALGAGAVGGPAVPAPGVTAHTNSDAGHAFMMKGADTITGVKNGFLNVAMGLGAVSQAFDRGAQTNDMDSDGVDDGNGYFYVSLGGYNKASVNDFATNKQVSGMGAEGYNQSRGFKGFCDNANTGAQCLSDIANDVMAPNGANFGANNQNTQNLIADQNNAEWTANLENPTQMFHYMPNATFATFDAFVSMKSKYVIDHNSDKTIALRHSDSTKSGTNYSLNFINGNDTNPYVNMEWQDNDGVVLTETAVTAVDTVQGVTYVTNQLRAAGATGNSVGGGTVLNGVDYVQTLAGTATDVANLVMTEKLNPIKQFGGSFDTSFESAALGPVVIRGEALYQDGVMSPVVTRKTASGQDLEHGFLVSSVKMVPGDRFKFVLGADITVLTNMMVSAQFIQDSNRSFVDTGDKDSTEWAYTADMATMSLTNNLNKGIKDKNFYSLFFSKPFGASGENRWSNILMIEEGAGENGHWNRFDVDFGISDDVQATVEVNTYGGNTNTQFGQLDKSDNMQVGVKYSF